MIRVPNAQSLSVLLGEPMDDTLPAPSPLAELSPKEIDQLIIRCRRALHSYRRESLHRNPAIAEEALGAIEGVHGILLELRQVAPEEKVAKIDALLIKSAKGEV